ncbi:MAG TPA: hypothetical protein VF587_19575 [Solirubrobacteraceae bacterium]
MGAAIAATWATVVVPPGTALAGAGSYSLGTGCVEQQAFVEGSEDAVAARVPDRYTVSRSSSGAPVIFARALRCDGMSVTGRPSVPVIMASYGVLIETPDGMGCGSASPAGSAKGDSPPVCNWYVVSLFTNRTRVARWLRSGTPRFPVSVVRSMDFSMEPSDPAAGAGSPFTFRSPEFAIDAVAQDNPNEIPVRGGYWADFGSTTVKLALAADVHAGGADGSVTATPGSDFAQLLGTAERPYLAPYSAFSSVRAERGIYRKQVVSPAGGGDSFDGSCSLAGTVKFTPPARNAPGPLAFTYEGDGTCSGALDGREVKDVPVHMFQSGRSYGGCLQAETVAPVEGAMTFASGQKLGYTLDFTTVGTEVDGMMYGERSGVARGKATFATDRTPPDVTARCAGEGVDEIPMDLSFSTDSPLVAEDGARGSSPGRPGPGSGSGDSGSGGGGDSRGTRRGGGRLRVSLVARRRIARRRTAFVFRVQRPSGRPAAGAIVRFAGRRARASRRGRARIVAVVTRSSRRVRVRATLPGFRAGRAVIRVRAARSR